MISFALIQVLDFWQGGFDVQLEFLLSCLSQGDSDGAYQAIISFLQETDFTSDPITNLVGGLAFSHLWYNSIQKEMQSQDSLEPSTPIHSGMSGINHSNGQCVVKVQDFYSAFERDSNTSIRIGKTIDENRVVPMQVDDNVKNEIQYEELHLNSLESDQTGNSS